MSVEQGAAGSGMVVDDVVLKCSLTWPSSF